MRLVVFSYKRCWRDDSSPSGFASVGGFGFQMRALSELFDQTRLVITLSPGVKPGAQPLTGVELEVRPLPTPAGWDLRRKLAMLTWVPRHLPRIWRETRRADAVHAVVPGDVGMLGMLAALAQRKPLLVRHCGTWGEPVTVVDRVLFALLERVAGGRNVVMATGGGNQRPSRRNPSVHWIFSTSLSAAELDRLSPARPWRAGERLKLVTVGRLSPGKNTAAVVRALRLVREQRPLATLDVVGDGGCRPELEQLAASEEVGEAVTFHGNVSSERVIEILSGSSVFVFPTRVNEGFSKAVLEAMACGLPVVATPVSVMPHLIGDRCGMLLKGADPVSVASAVLELTADEERLATLAANARETSRAYTLESWRELIGEHLRESWRQPLSATDTAPRAEVVRSQP